MSPKLNRAMLTTHITVSVGWFGAVAVFIALAITGIASANMQLARSSYVAMELSGWFVIVPFCIASLVTGIIQALGTKWGLLKHYWIVVKLILTLFATVALLLHMKPIGDLSLAAASTVDFTNALPDLKLQIVANAGAAFLLLLAIITISVFKPWGKTKWARGPESTLSSKQAAPNKSLRIYLIVAIALLLAFIIVKHLIGGGMGHH